MKTVTGLLLLIFGWASAGLGLAAEDIALTTPDGQSVVIERDTYGVPHIYSLTEAGLFFGQGFAVAQDRLFQMELFRRSALGRLAEIDPSQAASDRQVRTIFYTPFERQQQLAQASPEVQTMIESFTEGVNTYLDSVDTNPAKYMPIQFTRLPAEHWEATDVVALIQFFMSRFGQRGGKELQRLQELLTYGPQWFEERRPINDPEAPTTITAASRSAGPPGSAHSIGKQHRPHYDGPVVARAAMEAAARFAHRWTAHPHVPNSLGSFAVLIDRDKAAADVPLLLGAPQLGENPRRDDVSRGYELELVGPTFHAAGMTIPGLPSVIVGRNDQYAWSLTSGNTDNTDTYIETTDAAFENYRFEGAWVPFEVREETIYVRGQGPVTFPVYRTIHGPVIGRDPARQQAYSWKFSFRGDELDMVQAFYEIQTGENLAQFERALRTVPLSFNVVFAQRNRTIKYWHVGKYPLRPAHTDPRLPLDGRGAEEWKGFRPFDELPAATGRDQDYFVNWNNKPAPWWDQGDNVPWITLEKALTPEEERILELTFRVKVIDRYVGPIQEFTFEDLEGVVQAMDTVGTYTQVLELGPRQVKAKNLLPPGQSGFINLSGVPSPHTTDQWPLFESYLFKELRFAGPGAQTGSPPPRGPINRRLAAETAAGRPYALEHAYPSPASGQTTISYVLPEAQTVTLMLYDMLGREVMRFDEGRRAPGTYYITLTSADLPTGMYIYRLSTENFEQSRMLRVVR